MTDLSAQEAQLRASIRTFCADHDPASTPRDQFLSDRFDAGLAAVHYPVGHGGLGLPRSLQQAAEDQF
ncbi:MAG TPA: acyl-CoA dehydrogenase, partial [Streptosporangiaceae bacterium]